MTTRRSPSRVTSHPRPPRHTGPGQDAVLSLVTVLCGPVLILSGLHLLDISPAQWRDVPTAAYDLALTSSGGSRTAESLLGVLAAVSGAALSVLAALAGTASVLVAVWDRCGASAPRLLERLAPQFMRRSLALVLGTQLSLLGLGAPAAFAAPAQDGSAAPPAVSETFEQPDAPAAPAASPAPDSSTGTGSSSSADSGTSSQTLDDQETPVAPLFIPQAPEPAEDRHHQAPTRADADAGETVTVRPGDTLWEIAAAELGPGATDWEIAEAWPRWHEANYDLIGEDPAQLHPGTVLERPAAVHH